MGGTVHFDSGLGVRVMDSRNTAVPVWQIKHVTTCGHIFLSVIHSCFGSLFTAEEQRRKDPDVSTQLLVV